MDKVPSACLSRLPDVIRFTNSKPYTGENRLTKYFGGSDIRGAHLGLEGHLKAQQGQVEGGGGGASSEQHNMKLEGKVGVKSLEFGVNDNGCGRFPPPGGSN